MNLGLMSKQKFREQTGMGRDLLRELIADGVIPVVKLGDRSQYINLALLNELCLSGEIQELANKRTTSD